MPGPEKNRPAESSPVLLPGQSPVPPAEGDIWRDVALPGFVLRAASCQGHRPYQEDRFLARAAGFEDPAAALVKVMAEAGRAAARLEPGSTGTAVILARDFSLHVGFVGDSPLVLFLRDPETGEITADMLTRDHHAREPGERRRIERAGGRVALNGRVDGSLELSRAFGDRRYKGVTCEAEFARRDLKGVFAAGREVFLCLSSDGLYASLEPKDYIRVLRRALEAGKGAWFPDIFCAHACAEGSADNITVLGAKLPAQVEQDLFLAIADGHGGAETAEAVIASFRASPGEGG